MRVAILVLVALAGVLSANGLTSFAAAEQQSNIAGGGLASGATRRVTGKVSVAGSYQRPKPLPVFKNRSFCGATVPNETLLVGADGGLRNAVVMLHPLDSKVSTQPGALILDNKHCAFTPHVQVATVGSELLLKNSDSILHAVHARLGKETLFNVGLPKWRQVAKRLEQAGVIKIECDVLHTWMSTAIVVVATPFYSVTDQNGLFALDEIPAGSYQVEIWHERLGSKTARISVIANTDNSIEIAYGLNEKRR
jgi:hypothetical protein